MALPKIDTPILSIKIPSTEEIKTFRPFLVKEEKILLLANEGDEKDILTALKQIITNCCHDTIDVDKLTTFDIEYMFLKLRSKSVTNVVKLKFRDTEDEKVYDFEVNLDDVEMKYDDSHSKTVQVTDDIGISMKYPDMKTAEKISGITSVDELFTEVALNCIDTIYDKDNVYPASESSPEELREWLDQLDHNTFEKIQKFFDTMPKLHHEIKYKNSLDHDRTIVLNSVKDFFMLG